MTTTEQSKEYGRMGQQSTAWSGHDVDDYDQSKTDKEFTRLLALSRLPEVYKWLAKVFYYHDREHGLAALKEWSKPPFSAGALRTVQERKSDPFVRQDLL